MSEFRQAPGVFRPEAVSAMSEPPPAAGELAPMPRWPRVSTPALVLALGMVGVAMSLVQLESRSDRIARLTTAGDGLAVIRIYGWDCGASQFDEVEFSPSNGHRQRFRIVPGLRPDCVGGAADFRVEAGTGLLVRWEGPGLVTIRTRRSLISYLLPS